MTAGRTSVTQEKTWCTPRKYVDAVIQVLGHIDLDPCSGEGSIVPARDCYRLPQHDGLQLPWDAARIYVNPPYGRDAQRGTTIRAWLARCDKASREGSEVLALVPVATNTSHWKLHVFGSAAAVCFLADTRLKFRIGGSEANKGSPMAMSMVYWGPSQDRFREVFTAHGTVVFL